MPNLIDDGSLIGFWPLQEPSGAPRWKNYSPARAHHPSGISFDFNVHCADPGGVQQTDSAASRWPGQLILTNVHSGVVVRGLQMPGKMNINGVASDPFSNILMLGNGVDEIKTQTVSRPIAQSGFTAGLWVYPMSDGWTRAAFDGGFTPGAADSWITGYGRTHNLFGQFATDSGWFLGVSGELAGATQFNSEEFGGPHQLRGFLVVDRTNGANQRLDTPIESGRYTHLTMTYRYIDGAGNDEVVLYKDGRVAASGVTDQVLTLSQSIATRPLVLAAGTDGAVSTDSLDYGSGWDHLLSGVYHFRRVLHEGEVLEMHERGGLQPILSLHDNTTAVELTDPNLVLYIENKNYGLMDASPNHYGLSNSQDPGDNGVWTHSPGPFNTSRPFHAGVNSDQLVAPSGACFELAEGEGGFTIAGFFQPRGLRTNSRDESMLFSWGAVGTAVGASGDPASTPEGAVMGLNVSYYPGNVGTNITAEVFPLGNGYGHIPLYAPGNLIMRSTHFHVGFVYDRASRGVALYIDGYQAASGTLEHDLQDQMLRLAGSGYPAMFMNGVTDDVADSATVKGTFTDGGLNSACGPLLCMSRPLRADEMRAVSQSGISTVSLWRTRHDPRLIGYWPCDGFGLDDVLVEDKARAMSPFLGHLTKGDSDTKWARMAPGSNSDQSIYRDDGTAKVDLFNGETRTTPPELASYGNLGITSGTFSVMGLSPYGGFGLSNATSQRNSAYNLSARYSPAGEQRTLQPQSLHEYIISFDVTPSGNIQALDATSQFSTSTQRWFNSRLHTYGDLADSTADGEFASFLTSQNAQNPDPLGADAGTGASGITICFVARDGAVVGGIKPIISGVLPYGVPSKVLLHAKFEEPYSYSAFTTGSAPMSVSLWINGEKVNARRDTVTSLQLWSDQTPTSTSAGWRMQFGGYAGIDIVTTHVGTDSGLGEIYMREIFAMRGVFEDGEIEALAVSGIQNPSIAGFTSQLPTTQVTLADSALQGYWRFNGFDGNIGEVSNAPGGSGTTDLSFKGNHLDAIAQRFYEQGTSVDNAENLRAVPGPRRNSDLGVQCSGFYNQGVASSNTSTNQLPSHAVSGVAFDSPADGFSVGFLVATRDLVATNSASVLMCYGALTNNTGTDTNRDPNRGWAIYKDELEAVKMTVSLGGTMFLDQATNAATSGQITAGTASANNPLTDNRTFNAAQEGNSEPATLDNWTHYCWVYDPAGELRCYMNGVLVDQKKINYFNPQGGVFQNPWTGDVIAPQTPVTPEARMITFRSHQTAGQDPWTFTTGGQSDVDAVMTDAFYFSRALTEAEVRYVAFNGIDGAVGTPTSGVIGGFVHGQDTGSGHMGGYQQGLDTGSGHFGGYFAGAIQGSGLIGGYVSGVIFGIGSVGGWLQGLDYGSGHFGGLIYGSEVGSGNIAGYIRGQDVGSGLFGGFVFSANLGSGNIGGYVQASQLASGIAGGFMLGGFQGINFEFDAGFTVEVMAAEDFDAQLEIAKTTSADFDAKVIIFQNELPPYVDIIVPSAPVSGLVPPFNQYFVGFASGQQGKTIDSTRWTFGDLSPAVTVAESGAGLYPVQHMYAGSGFYIAKFEAIDSDGMHSSATRIINAASGIDPVIISLSGVPRAGSAELIVDFTTTIDILPDDVSVVSKLLAFDDGQTTISFNPTHSYTQPGTYKPIWCVRDSRGVIWCDSLEAGNDLLESERGS